MLVDSPIWFKPFKFAVSFVLYSASLAWFISLLEGRLHRSHGGSARRSR